MIRRSASGLLLLAALLQLGIAAPAASADQSWSAPATLGPTGRESGGPEIAVAPDGEAIASWVGGRPARVLVSTRPPGGGWTRPVTLARAREEIDGPEVAVSAGKTIVVWSDYRRTRRNWGPSRVILAATRFGQGHWSRPRNISRERRRRFEPEGREPQVAMAADGTAVVIWEANDIGHSTASFIRTETQDAATARWTKPVALRGSIEGEVPQVALTPGGEAVAIWGATYNEESGIEASSRVPGAKWERAGRIGHPGAFPQPRLAITSEREAIGTWIKRSEESPDSAIQVATRAPGGKWSVDTLAPGSDASSPLIVTEPGGGARVVWLKGSSLEQQEFVSSTHSPGAGWTEPVSLGAEGLQLPVDADLQLEVTGAGESIAVWSTFSAVKGSLAVRSSSRPRGGPWNPPADISITPAGRQYGDPRLQLALAPSGEALAAWRCFDGRRWVIRVASRAPAGAS